MASSSAQEGSLLPPQYHHFIPRFLLRNFAVFKNPGNVKPRTGRGKKKPAPVPSRLNTLDFASGTLIQDDVAHTFGIVDMYRDITASGSDPFDLEKRLSRLENDAARIFADIKRAHDSGRGDIHLKRSEKDLLRRFLFIMLYRNKTLAGRYEKSTEEYDAVDREAMLSYMQEHSFRTPRDVWFSNIRAFLEIDLSKEWQQWYPELHARAYPSDARWFFKNMQMSYLAFCTPETADEEFLLTQNSYGVFEGPSSPSGAWTDYHVFAPVSPRLLMVTRSFLLPSGNDGEAGEEERLAMLEQSKSMHFDPASADSCLEDLPIAKARNNYTRMLDGKLVLLPTRISREKHIFFFKFFAIKATHVQKINQIFLEEALGTTQLVYKSSIGLRLALEYYLTSEDPGFKQVIRKMDADLPDHIPRLDGDAWDTRREENRLPFLRILENIAKTLGSTVTAKYNMIDPVGLAGSKHIGTELIDWYRKIGKTGDKGPVSSRIMDLYGKFGSYIKS
ncbi:MAG: hypothetical protein Q9195_006764 [Heterodermia aff. obscurata]